MKTQVKKGLLINFREYILAVYGLDRFNGWVSSLSEHPQKAFLNCVFNKSWYDADEFYIKPAIALCKMTDKGRTNPVWNSGVWGVETWLKGPVKLVFELLSAEQLLKYFLPMSATYYYRPVKVVRISVKPGEAVIYIEGMHGAESMLAYRFGGGAERMLQLKGCKNVLVQISTSHEMFADSTVFFMTWN